MTILNPEQVRLALAACDAKVRYFDALRDFERVTAPEQSGRDDWDDDVNNAVIAEIDNLIAAGEPRAKDVKELVLIATGRDKP